MTRRRSLSSAQGRGLSSGSWSRIRPSDPQLLSTAHDVTLREKHHCVAFNRPLNETLTEQSDESPRLCFLLHLSAAENHSAPPDVTGYSSDSSHSHTERHHMANMGTIARNTQKYGNAERMETGDGKSPNRSG